MPLPLTISWAVKSRLILPFWYRLTWVVPDKGPLNGGVCCLTYVSWNILHFVFSLQLGVINCHDVWSMVDRIVCYENYAPRHTTTWMFSVYSVQQQHLQLVNPKNGTMWYVTCEVCFTSDIPHCILFATRKFHCTGEKFLLAIYQFVTQKLLKCHVICRLQLFIARSRVCRRWQMSWSFMLL